MGKFSKMGRGGRHLAYEKIIKKIKIENSRAVAENEAAETLVTGFIEAENSKDFEKQRALKGVIANLVKPEAVKFVDSFLESDAFKNSDDPKARADALLVRANLVGDSTGFGLVNGEVYKTKNL